MNVVTVERWIGKPDHWQGLFTAGQLAALNANHIVQQHTDVSMIVQPVAWLAMVKGDGLLWEAMLTECDPDGYANGLCCISVAEMGAVYLPEIIETAQGSGYEFIERHIKPPVLTLFQYYEISGMNERIMEGNSE